MIGGKPLPPNATRIFIISDFTLELLNEIEHHQNAGNVQLLEVGRSGGEADIGEIRKQLGFPGRNIEILTPARETVGQVVLDYIKSELRAASEGDGIPERMKKATNFRKIEPPKVEVKVGEVKVEVSAGEDKTFGTKDDIVEVTPAAASKAPPLPPQSDGMDINDILEEPEMSDEPVLYTAEELASLKKDDLISIFAKVVGGPYTGKSKGVLAEEILKAQVKE
jgi:hypothetical protein